MPLRLLGVLVPHEGEVLDGARLANALEHLQCGAHDLALRFSISHVAVGPAEGVFERRDARQASLGSKESQADSVVPNDGDLEEARGHVKRFWTEHVEPRL